MEWSIGIDWGVGPTPDQIVERDRIRVALADHATALLRRVHRRIRRTQRAVENALAEPWIDLGGESGGA